MEPEPNGVRPVALIVIKNETSDNCTVPVDTFAETSGETQPTYHTDHNYGKVPTVKIIKVYPGSVLDRCTNSLQFLEKEDSTVELEFSQQMSEENDDSSREETTDSNSSCWSYPKKVKKPFPCSLCSSVYTSNAALWKHKVKKHPEWRSQMPTRPTVPCPDCTDFQAPSHREFVEHQINNHNKDIQILSRKFASETEFKLWKSDVEKETFSKFNSNRGKLTNVAFTRKHYYCHRSGKPHLLQSRKRKFKRQGSCKIGSRCTAYIIAKFDKRDKTVDVEYCLHHIGHTFDPVHLRLSEDLKTSIAHKLCEGVDPSDIVEDIRDNASEVNRDTLLTVKDIHNIKSQYKILLPPKEKRLYVCRICNLQCKSRHGLTYHKIRKHPKASSGIAINKCPAVNPDHQHEEQIMGAQGETNRTEVLNFSEEEYEYVQCELNHLRTVVLQEEKTADFDDIVELKKIAMSRLNDIMDTIAKSNDISVLQEIIKNLTDTYNVAVGFRKG